MARLGKRTALLLTGVAILASAALTATKAEAAPGPGVVHTIRSLGAQSARTRSPFPQVDVCFDADLNSLGRNGTKVQLWSCNDETQQNWYYQPVNSTDAVIKNTRAGSGYCLDADTNTIGKNGTKLQLWTCNGSSQQLWRGFGTQTITNVRAGNGFCLDADSNTIGGNGTKVQLWGCNTRVQQDWALSVPYTKTCKTFSIDRPGQWQFTSTGGQGVHVDVVNASISWAQVSALQNGVQVYSSTISVEGEDSFVASASGHEPVNRTFTFIVNGPNIKNMGIFVHSYIC